MKKPYYTPAIEEICLNMGIVLSASGEVSSTYTINGWKEGETTNDAVVF